MNAVLDFICAVSLWVAMGLLLAIFAVRDSVKKGRVRSRMAITALKVCALECALVCLSAQCLKASSASAYRSV